jgi:hypothetical protein
MKIRYLPLALLAMFAPLMLAAGAKDAPSAYHLLGTPTADRPHPRPVPVPGTFRLMVLGR